MKVAFIHSGKAYLPELSAYKKCLLDAGHDALVLHDQRCVLDYTDIDLVFRFGGFLRDIKGANLPEIHEYHSASTASFPRIKNYIKSRANVRPRRRIFLNEFVHEQFSFVDTIPFIYRDMGASSRLLWCRDVQDKCFDIVYAGSIVGRPGLMAVFAKLAAAGLKVGIAGAVSPGHVDFLLALPGITYVGGLEAHEVPGFLAQGRYGLNYCPDIYPLNQQTSTKAIEYLVAGLPIISNKYDWIDKHSQKHGYGYINLSDAYVPKRLDFMFIENLILSCPDRFLWENILLECRFLAFLDESIG